MVRRFTTRFFSFAFSIVSIAMLVVGCNGTRPPPPKNLPPPQPSTTIGAGDVFEVYVAGEQNIPKEFRVYPDGTIDFPYVTKVSVAGLEPQEIAARIKQKLKDSGILTDPQVSVNIKQYNSKKVTIIGQVTKPGSVGFSDGMKLVEALSSSGWFTSMADTNHVILTRQVSPTKTVTAIVSVDAITDGAQADIPLQAGDTIKVDQRVF